VIVLFSMEAVEKLEMEREFTKKARQGVVEQFSLYLGTTPLAFLGLPSFVCTDIFIRLAAQTEIPCERVPWGHHGTDPQS